MSRAPESESAQNESVIAFDDINLQVGASVQVQSADGGGQRYFATVIGFVKGKTLLVSNPVVDDKLIFVREGQSFIVRVFNGKSAYGFSSSILKACTMPIAYLHLSFPKRIQGVPIRRSDRMDVKLIASIQSMLEDADKATLPALILNVSPAGALIHAKQTLGKVGDAIKVTFRIKLNMIDGYVEADGVIRSIKEAAQDQPNAPGLLHGVEFIELRQNDILLLHSLAYQKLTARNESG